MKNGRPNAEDAVPAAALLTGIRVNIYEKAKMVISVKFTIIGSGRERPSAAKI